MHKLKPLFLLSLIGLLILPFAGIHAQSEDEKREALVAIVADSDEFSDWLEDYPDYQFNAWGPDENQIWYIEFFDESWEEWLGYANINEDSLEIQDSFAPKPLPTDVYQEQLDIVLPYVLADAEVMGWLNDNPDLWDNYTDWNRWEQIWDVAFYRGITAVVVKVRVDENSNPYIDAIVDPNVLDEEDALDEARNAAINLAYGAEGIDAALEGYDDWASYAEPQGGDVWSVTFAATDKLLFFALVNLENEEILETYTGD